MPGMRNNRIMTLIFQTKVALLILNILREFSMKPKRTKVQKRKKRDKNRLHYFALLRQSTIKSYCKICHNPFAECQNRIQETSGIRLTFSTRKNLCESFPRSDLTLRFPPSRCTPPLSLRSLSPSVRALSLVLGRRKLFIRTTNKLDHSAETSN